MGKHVFGKLEDLIIGKLNNYNLKKKMFMLYIFSLIITLIFTDSIIFYIIQRGEKINKQYEIESIGKSVEFILRSKLNNAKDVSNNIYLSRIMENFLDEQYLNDLDYFSNYYSKMKDSLYKSYNGPENLSITFYTSNPTIINGGDFAKIESVENEEWFTKYIDKDENIFSYIYFDDKEHPEQNYKQKISLIRKLDYFKNNNFENIVKIDLNYNEIMRTLINANYTSDVYICSDGKIVFSNLINNSNNVGFEDFSLLSQVAYSDKVLFYNTTFDIYVMEKEYIFVEQIKNNSGLIMLMIVTNIILPYLFAKLINKSFVERLNILSKTFNRFNSESLVEISDVQGNDEISELMSDYNRMVNRINELIDQVYKQEIKKHEIDIARQNAELLALYSQINPHFLFNALESIRMHSLVKNEVETADMINSLAKLQRKHIEWGHDNDKIKEEIENVSAYLNLQKNRFGNRLNYEIDVEEKCLEYKIPKLTILTFVENACIHGVERKASPVWIFVKIYEKGNFVCIEIEDTGCGIEKEKKKIILENMYIDDIGKVKNLENIGIANACLRINLFTNGNAIYGIEAEENVGSLFTIKLPEVFVKEEK